MDVLFGGKGAEELRELHDLAGALFTHPPGTHNASGTAGFMRQVLVDSLLTTTTGHPAVVASAVKAGKGALRSRQRKKSADAAVKQPEGHGSD